jgi:pimeloyl-ACP methyl ester carboxylesterase
LGLPEPGHPVLVLLHEGLGSVGLWRDFPHRLAAATGLPVLVYSRQGNGRSSPLGQARTPAYMHDEAREVLPAVLQAFGIQRPLLVGHSDGGSIALIHAGSFPGIACGVVAIAPHLFVEDLTVESIRAAKVAYETTDLRARLARHHADADNTFYGWNDIWLHADFRAWNIEDCVARVACPVLAIQGVDDEYGSMRQIDRLAELLPGTRLEKLPACGHAPHRDQPARLLGACREFIASIQGGSASA